MSDKRIVEYTSTHGIFFQNRILDQGYTVKPASHFQYEILYLLKGSMKVSINGKEYIVNEGDMVIIDLYEFHASEMFEGVETHLMVIQFSIDVLPSYVQLKITDYIKSNFMFSHKIPAKYVKTGKVAETMQAINDMLENEKSDYIETFLASHLLRLVGEVNTILDSFAESEIFKIVGNGGRNVALNQCIHFINENIHKNLSIDDISQSCFVSRSYLQHSFKKEFGVSVSEFILTKKMSLARYWLLLGRSPTKVALDLGYEYYTTFYAKFKKFYGFSPKKLNVSTLVTNVIKDE